ncbi:MAG: Crp/Fnr family transcriptional regulator, partial [Acetivibrio ethanolgignens]
AEKETQVYLIPSSIYSEVQKESLAVSEYTNELLSSRMSDLMWVMEQVLFMSFDKRLAIFLLEQSAIEGKDTFKMTQEMMARHLGSAREVVSRMLKYFADEGLVEVSRGSVTLLDRKKLEKLAY